ncbi:hypothetical protein NKH18_12740 [Streptomyces sp. M10(2022)]
MWLALCVGTESVNRIADREADVVNQPGRTRLCEEFGWGRLTRVAVASWVLFAVCGAALLWTSPSVVLAVLLLADMAIAICYSVGPAFKRHRVLALVALITPLVMPVLTGWAVGATPVSCWILYCPLPQCWRRSLWGWQASRTSPTWRATANWVTRACGCSWPGCGAARLSTP